MYQVSKSQTLEIFSKLCLVNTKAESGSYESKPNNVIRLVVCMQLHTVKPR